MLKKELFFLGVFLYIIGGLLLFLVWAMPALQPEQNLMVEVDGELYAELSLHKDQELLIENGEHYNKLVIKDNKAFIAEANCPDHVCMRTELSFVTPIACLPHGVLIYLAQENTAVLSPAFFVTLALYLALLACSLYLYIKKHGKLSEKEKVEKEIEKAYLIDRDTQVQRITTLGILTALALILSYLEHIITLGIFMPGIKLGLANLVVVLLLYRYRPLYAAWAGLLRVVLASLLFGNVQSYLFSLCAYICSVAVMILLLQTRRFSIVGVSMFGAITHNITQIFVASILYQTHAFFFSAYLPVMLFSGVLAGFIIGTLARKILLHLPKNLRQK